MEQTLANNGGRLSSPYNDYDPVLASGQLLTATNAATDYTVTVVAGATYAITVVPAAATPAGNLVLSVTDVITTAANVEWAAGAGHTLLITIPQGYTTLHYGSNAAATTARLRRLKSRTDWAE